MFRRWQSIAPAMAAWLVFGLVNDADARVRWSSPGSYRLRSIHTPAFQLDESGRSSPELSWWRHRLRLQPRVEVGPFKMFLELDVLTGQIYGDTTQFGEALSERRQPEPSNEFDGWTTVEPRYGWMELRFTHIDIRAGQMARHWGLGLYAHDGDDRNRPEPWVLRPDDAWNGDIIDSLQVTVRPFATVPIGILNGLSLTAAIGYVYQDENASALDDDDALEFELTLGYASRRIAWSLHYLKRDQTDRDDRLFKEEVVDGHFEWIAPLFLSNAELLFAAEALAVNGETTRWTFDGVTPTRRRAYAAVLRAALRWLCPRIALGFDAGVVSGDDPKSISDESFTTDPDYGVGFVFFREVMRAVSMRGGEALLLEETQVARGLGSRSQPTDGGLRNVAFVSPGFTWRPSDLTFGLITSTGWTLEPLTTTRELLAIRSGASEATVGAAYEYLGTEITSMARYRLKWRRFSSGTLGVDLGVFVPGMAAKRLIGGDILPKIVWRLDLGW